ncbi:hypothetical protein Zmor_012870 [Zophobas morio]|uniref:CHK kinase-like domain-containing protein n=1 Tax=Zophobas morio TaxID=2755281 RepID=A0AA38ME53_9CUCU|nr:hypothetical protein Zmor_012870 [Zophobas morio]
MVQFLSTQDCEFIVRQILNSNDVSDVDFALKPLSERNFDLEINFRHEKETKSLTFFAKLATNLPKINNIVDNFNITPKIRYVKENFIVFENLESQSFQKCESLTVEHFCAVLKVLASFHAAGLTFQETKQKNNQTNVNLREPEVVALVSSMVDNKEEISRVVEELEERQLHSPTYDLLQVIFFNTTAQFRQHHWKILLDHYYDCLKQEIQDTILPVDDFHLSVHYFLPLVKLEAARLHQNETALEELKEILNCPVVSKEDCYTIVKNRLVTTNYTFVSFKVTPLDNVSGFMGQYHNLQVKILHLCEETTISCFIKSVPRPGTPTAIAAQDFNSFAREFFTYETLVVEMQNHGIDTINECVPRCFFHRPKQFMVFDDLAFRGYANLDSMKPLDVNMLTLLVKTLAKFHACSLILEEKVSRDEEKPYRLYHAYKDQFKEAMFFHDANHRGARQVATGVKSVAAAVNLLGEIQTETNLRNFSKFWPTLQDLYYELPKPSDRFRNVVCHGDIWTSNMMVKFENDEATDCVLFDFQFVRYCPPAYDLLQVLYLTTHRATRLKFEDQLVKIYHDELGKILSFYGVNIDDFYPFGVFVESLNYIRPHMVLHAARECVLTMCTPEEIASFLTDEEKSNRVFFEDRTDFMTYMCEKSALYKKRLQECVLDIYDYCNFVCKN